MNFNYIQEQDLSSSTIVQTSSTNENDSNIPSNDKKLEKLLQMKRYGKENKNETNQRGHRKNKHSRYSLDNVKIKLFSHFCNYIINFTNDYIKKIFGYQKRKLRKIQYCIKKNIFRDSLFKLMNKTIEDFCNLDISFKYKKETDQNSVNFQIIKEYLDQEFIKIKLLDFYKSFYLEQNPIREEKIKNDYELSDKTENFKSFYLRQNEKEMMIQLFKASKHFINVKEKLNRKINANKKKEDQLKQIEKENNILFNFDENNTDETGFKTFMNSSFI